MSVVEELRQNDPENPSICLQLRYETSDAALARALEQNPFVTEIRLNMEDRDEEQQQRPGWNSLVRVIATRANLEKVILAERRAPAGLVRAFLQAIQQNTSIRSVDLQWVRLPIYISTFVDTASSITSFSIYGCDMEAAERQQGARSLAAAIQRNTNIDTLRLGHLEDIYSIPILEGLVSTVSLKTLIYSLTHVSDATSHALQRLLESTTSIQRFELREAYFSNEQLSRPIAQGIINSECVSELKLSDCRFHDSGSFAQLQSILQNKRNLTSLCFADCDGFHRGTTHGDNIIAILSRPDSLLRCFEFQSLYSVENVFSRIQFQNLVRAIERSKLARLKLGNIETFQQLQTLMQSIPAMKLKELEVKFWFDEDSDEEDEAQDEFNREAIRQDLLHAVKNNFSLRSVKARAHDYTGEEFDLFDSVEEKQRLAFYTNRNELLDQWDSNPDLVERKVWPDALGLAERAGPDALFRGLRSVLESDYVSLPGGRKRKRPQY